MLWSKVLTPSFLLLPVVLAGAAPLSAQTGTIRGEIREASAQNPIVGAQILVVGTRLGAVSDQQGNYTLTNVPLGRITVRVRMLGYSSMSSAVDVSSDAPATLNFALSPSVITLEEVVVTGTGGAEIGRAHV